jgi:hypothetical protein
MTMKTKLLICLGALLGIATADVVKNRLETPRARLTIKVLDEQDAPVPDAKVSLVFMDPATRARLPVEGLTGVEGVFTGEGHTDGAMGGSIAKDGFYRGAPAFERFTALKDNQWQPWGETYTSHLRPVVNPVPMYAQRGWIEVPSAGVPCGYDLEKSDWVAPNGKGAVSDLQFLLSRRYVSRQDFDVSVTVTFANKLDGIQPAEMPNVGRHSAFKWLRQAPETGYSAMLETRFKSDPKSGLEQNANEEQMYFFRVRSVEQNGRLVSANYGKIKGGLLLAPSNSKTCKIELSYYLNPTSLDRNMEWDPKRNLLSGLSREKTPQEP